MDIAIIGLSGRFPEAKNIDEFLKNLSAGRDSIKELSKDRKRKTTIAENEEYRPIGFLEDIDLFDPEFFGISMGEAQHMDPHQRLLLELVYETFENAGYNIDDYNGSRTAFYCGYAAHHYFEHASEFAPTLATGNSASIILGRIARFFNLRGTALLVDTGCSSSAVALHQACNEIILGEADAALVCGATIQLFPRNKENELNFIGTSSHDGRSRTFSAEANGTGSGEAIGCILIKPLEKALADNDTIHAIIKSTSCNQDAALSGSLTAPSSKAQSEVIFRAWEKAKIDPETISLIEAHGTGTKLGDPIEIQGLELAFRQKTDKNQFCAISAAKSNIGHTDTAAGIVGIIKTVLSLKYKKLFPSLHFEKPNPFINFINSPLYVNEKLRDWEVEKNVPRRAGINSFGMSGTSCHIVLEEACEGETTGEIEKPDSESIFIVSAKTRSSLLANTQNLIDHLQLNVDLHLPSLSYTLLAGRKHYQYYLSVAAKSQKELLDELKKAIAEDEFVYLNKEFKPIILFSDLSDVSNGTIDHLRNGYSFFREAYDKCIEVSNKPDSTNFRIFSFQYSFFKLLEHVGIRSKVLLGDGIGKLVISAITNQETLEESIIKALDYELKPANIRERCQALIQKVGDENTVFIEMGELGNISNELLKQQSQPLNKYSLIYAESLNSDFFSDYLLKLQAFNFKLDWKKCFDINHVDRLSLPLYSFDRKRCWIKEAYDEYENEGLYEIAWQSEAIDQVAKELPQNNTFIIIKDDTGLADALIDKLSLLNNDCIHVEFGENFKQLSSNSFSIRSGNSQDIIRLKTEIDLATPKIDGVFFVKGFDAVEKNHFDNALSFLLYTPFELIKVLHSSFSHDFRIVVINSATHLINDSDQIIEPIKTSSEAFFKAVLTEYPFINLNSIDFGHTENGLDALADTVLKEIVNESNIKFVGYRKEHRSVQGLREIHHNDHGKDLHNFRTNGTYIITGGATGIGYEIGKYLAELGPVNLVILGRTELPINWESNEFNREKPSLKNRIKSLKSLNKLGANVRYRSIDVGDKDQMRILSNQLSEEYDNLDGIFHCAGVVIDQISIKDNSVELFQKTLLPKIDGTVNIQELANENLCGFVFAFSSLNSTVPQKNSAAYAAANAYINGMSYVESNSNKLLSVQWPGWRNVISATNPLNKKSDENEVLLKSLSTAEGIYLIRKVLGGLKKVINPLIIRAELSNFANNPFFKIANSTFDSISENKQVKISSAETKEDLCTEDILHNIWVDVLKKHDISVDDDFFEIGGHSLNARQVLNKLDRKFEISIEFEDIFAYPTIRSLSSKIDTIKNSNVVAHYKPLTAASPSQYYPMSYAQKRLWVSEQLHLGESVYNVSQAFELTGEFDMEAMEAAFRTIIDRHEILRTTFHSVQGELVQHVLSSNEVQNYLEKIDICNGTGVEQNNVEFYLEKEYQQSFNLSDSPPFRIMILKTGNSNHVLTITFHHIITDALSLIVFFRELLEYYNAHSNNELVNQKDLPIQYKDYAVWQTELFKTGALEECREYWFEKFINPVVQIDLPTEFERPKVKTFAGDRIRIALDKKYKKGLSELSKRNNTTLYTVLLTSVKSLLYHYTGEEDITIGGAFDGRINENLEGQIGYYISTLPLRTVFDGEDTFEQVISKVKDTVMGAHRYQMYPIDRLIKEVSIERDMSRSPLYDVMLEFVQLSIESDDQVINDVSIRSIEQDKKYSKFDLTFFFNEYEEDLFVTLEFNTDLFTVERAELILQHYQNLLKSIIDCPSDPLHAMEYLSESEKMDLLN